MKGFDWVRNHPVLSLALPAAIIAGLWFGWPYLSQAPTTDREPTVSQSSAPAAVPAEPAVEPQPAASAPAQDVAATEPAAAPAPAPAPSSAPVPDRGTMPQIDLRNGLIAARRAFWSGDHQTAESTYLQLADRYPTRPELSGELGNLYYAQGRMDDAAEQFYQTAMRLLEGRSPGQAHALVGVLQRLAPDRATDISDRLRKALMPSGGKQ